TRWGRLVAPHFGQVERAGGVSASCARRIRDCDLDIFFFGPTMTESFSLPAAGCSARFLEHLSQAGERPAGLLRVAGAGLLAPHRAAHRAQPKARLRAEWLHGPRERQNFQNDRAEV